MERERWYYMAGAVYLLVVVTVVVTLAFVEVPQGNSAIINALAGALVGGLTVSVDRLMGRSEKELTAQRRQCDDAINELERKLGELAAKHATLQAEHDQVMRRMVKHLAMVGDRPFIDTDFKDSRPGAPNA